MLPNDPNMLLSYINTGLRDKYSDLDDMAAAEDFDAHAVSEKLEGAGYSYDSDLKRFVAK
ncbi:MAG: DUF4250 domain-containing protein [Lachnospiraceae bacterium]|nr:DUF4250 domain-containing protein [Lachnospiraceae bacterium]MCR5410223.1 DUF4250 domain-containing protein [Lachnospiraceae bacterium]